MAMAEQPEPNTEDYVASMSPYEALVYALYYGDAASWDRLAEVAARTATAATLPDMAHFDPTAVERARVVLVEGGLLVHACTLVQGSGGADAWRLLTAVARAEAATARERGVRLLVPGGPVNAIDPRLRHWSPGSGGVVYMGYDAIITSSDRRWINKYNSPT